MKISVFWFRRDLRIEDNTALQQALKSGNKVLVVFIFDESILSELKEDDARFTFIYDTLKEINSKLLEKGSSILCYQGKVLDCWQQICSEFNVDQVYINKDYEPYARKRDLEVQEFLVKQNIGVHFHKDQVIFEEKEILKADGKPYTVFTPYKNKWMAAYNELTINPPAKIDLHAFLPIKTDFPSIEDLGFKRSSIKVRPFTLEVVNNYADQRDFPAIDQTSYLSPHLRFGTISVRSILKQVDPSKLTFISELIWREFFMQILYHFPKVTQANFKSKYDGIQWNNSEEDFQKWCDGRTGYPMVDAGMRQLNETGYMHNRVRMITAGFLCKHLLIDWRWGEAYFASKLLDYELSSNNGNWQWAAGTGCDAAPYFRIFNPMEQLKKFDKGEKYVSRWIPEYGTPLYPLPMIEHSFARKRALERYKEGIL